MIKRSGDAMCDLHRAQGDEQRGFLGLASSPKSMVFPGLASKPVATVLVVWPQNHSLGFLSSGLKTGSCGLVIWPIKSPRQFLSLAQKTKWAMVCRLHHKTDRRMKMERDTCQDIAACFVWKRVGLGFPSLASRLAEAWHICCT
jgi:hypothetical protein